MLSTKRTLVAGLLAVALAMPLTTQAAEYSLTMQTNSPEASMVTIVLKEWAKTIEEKSQGRVSIKLVSNSAITRLEGSYKGVEAGAVDISTFSPHFVMNDLPYANAAYPCASRDAVHGTKFLWKLYNEQEEMRKDLEKVEVLAMWATDRDCFLSIKEPLLKPESFKGKRLMIMAAGPNADTMAGMGATPVQVGVGEVYVGLQRGMGEGLLASVPMIRSLKLNEVIKYVVVFPVQGSTSYLAMNKDLFNDLPQDLQAIFKENSGEAFSTKIAQMAFDASNKDLEQCAAEGIQIIYPTEEEAEALRHHFMTTGLESWRVLLSKSRLAPNFDAWVKTVYDTANSLL